MSIDASDSQDFSAALRRRALREIHAALRKLARVARGLDHFGNDRQARACICLVRLAPILLSETRPQPRRNARGDYSDDDDETSLVHPRHTPEEADLLLQRMEYIHSLTPEQRNEQTAAAEARMKEWNEQHERYRAGQGPPVCHISELADLSFPEHLRMSTLKKKEAKP